MIEDNASSHYEGLSETYASMMTRPFSSLNRYAITDTIIINIKDWTL